MTSESKDNIENDGGNSKEEHIKQRLKEMGVSEDSERPEKSFVSKYGKYFVVVIFVALIAAYWFELNKKTETDADQVVASTTSTDSTQQQTAAYGNGNSMQPPAWAQPPQGQMSQSNEPPAWIQQRQAQMPQRPEPPAWVQERRTQMAQQRPEPPAWIQERRAQMAQQPEPPQWVQERRSAWGQPPIANSQENSNSNNTDQSVNNQANINPYYAQRYTPYPPHSYWQSYPGYYPNSGYLQNVPAPMYPPYGGGYPYYNGW